MTLRKTPKPLKGWRVLVPRGGEWGNNIAARLRKFGAIPEIAPMINFARTQNVRELSDAFARLEEGAFEWVVVTSSTTVDVLVGHDAQISPATRVAAIGEMTASALHSAGYRVDLVPDSDNSARGLVKEWAATPPAGTVLVPQSEGADGALASGLETLGIVAEFVTAYRTVGVPVPDDVAEDVASGAIRGILITSGGIARQIEQQLAPLPETTVVVAIGPRTAFEARSANITVDIIAEDRTGEALVEALVEQAVK